MKMEYCLSDKAMQAEILAGRTPSQYQTLEFQPSEVSEKARQLWMQIFGSATNVTLYTPAIRGGHVYDGGSASSDPPRLDNGDRYEADKVLAAADLEAVLTSVVAQKQALEAELPQRHETWQKARHAYLARKAKEKIQREKAEAEKKAKVEAQAKHIANLPWVKQLTEKLDIVDKSHAEVSRFLTKFTLAPEDIQTQSVSDSPYVRISVTVPVTVAGMERELKITNRTYEDVGEDEYSQFENPEFSDLAEEIAKALAEVFSGEVQVVANYDRREAYLNVVTEGDTIQVATCDIAEDC